MDDSLYIVDIIGEVVAAVDAVLFPSLNKHILYEYGRSSQILKEVIKLGNNKDPKYPLFALFQDFPENTDTFYYCKVRFPKILIANFTDNNWPNPKKYELNFKPVLYPIYNEFLKQLPRNKNIVGVDFTHLKWDRPGTQPAADPKLQGNFSDFLDGIELQNLDVTFKQVKFCKQL